MGDGRSAERSVSGGRSCQVLREVAVSREGRCCPKLTPTVLNRVPGVSEFATGQRTPSLDRWAFLFTQYVPKEISSSSRRGGMKSLMGIPSR